MLVLTTADKIEVERSSTANVDCTGHYVDTTASTPGLAVATFSTASTGDLIVAPGADLRLVKSIYICNRHASTTNTIKVKLDKSATEYILCIATLQASDTLIYDDSGWYILSATGNRVSPFVMSGDGTLDAAGVLTLGVNAITGKTEDTSPLDADFTLTYDTSAAALKKVLLSNLKKPYPSSICDGRITLETGVPISSTDQTAKTNLFFTPYNGNQITIYDGSAWKLFTFTQLTLALGTLTSALSYDVFIYDNSGTPTLELLAWTSATVRATALVIQDGVYVKTGATTRRWLGSFYTTSTTTTEDSRAKRLLYNAYNQVPRSLLVLDTTDSWTYTTDTYRQANGATANQVAVMTGLAENALTVRVQVLTNGTATRSLAIGVNAITVHADCIPGYIPAADTSNHAVSSLIHTPAAGYNYYTWLERSSAIGTTTWFGDNADQTRFGAGMNGLVVM